MHRDVAIEHLDAVPTLAQESMLHPVMGVAVMVFDQQVRKVVSFVSIVDQTGTHQLRRLLGALLCLCG